MGAAAFVTDFADAGVIAPVTLAVAAALFATGQRRAAGFWVAMTASVWLLMVALKFGGYLCASLGCAVPPESIHLVSPSGHVAASAAIYGGLLGLALRSAGRSLAVCIAAAVAIAAGIGLTRLVLDEHSVAEVIAGGCVGVLGAVGFIGAARAWRDAARIDGRRRAVLLGVVAVAALAFHGTHLNWETRIRAASAKAAQMLAEVR